MASESILTNDVSAMIPIEKDIFASDSENLDSPTNGTVGNRDIDDILNINLPGSNSRQMIKDSSGQTSIRALNVQEDEEQLSEENMNTNPDAVNANSAPEKAANEIPTTSKNNVFDNIEKEMEALHGGVNIVEGQEIECDEAEEVPGDLPGDAEGQHGDQHGDLHGDLPGDAEDLPGDAEDLLGDAEDLPGVLTAAVREDEVVTDDDGGLLPKSFERYFTLNICCLKDRIHTWGKT